MNDDTQFERQRQVCSGIRRMYLARQAGLHALDEEIARLNNEFRAMIGQKLHSNDEDEIARINRAQRENRNKRDRLMRERVAKARQLNEIENDYLINGCQDVMGPLR